MKIKTLRGKNKMMKTALSVMMVAALGLMTQNLWAAGKGESGGQFLRIGAGARGPAMAGSFSTIVDDATSIYWNPAGMAGMEKKELSLSYNDYFVDSASQFIGYAHPMSRGVMGIGISAFGVKDIDKRSAASGDADAPDLGQFDTRDIAFSVGWAAKRSSLDWGAALKYISSDLEAEKAQTAAFDLGAKYHFGNSGLLMSLAILNLGGELKFKNQGDPLPLNVKPGMAYKWNWRYWGHIMASLDSDILVHDGIAFIQPGLEWNAHRMLSLRSGYQVGRDDGAGSGFAAGLGFRVLKLSLDYAFVPFEELGDTHRMSIGLKF